MWLTFLSLGSIIADIEVHGPKTDTKDLQRNMVTSTLRLLSGEEKLIVNGHDVNVIEMAQKDDNGRSVICKSGSVIYWNS